MGEYTCMNKGDQNVYCFSQFKTSYGKVWAELGFFQASCYMKIDAKEEEEGREGGRIRWWAFACSPPAKDVSWLSVQFCLDE